MLKAVYYLMTFWKVIVKSGCHFISLIYHLLGAPISRYIKPIRKSNRC